MRVTAWAFILFCISLLDGNQAVMAIGPDSLLLNKSRLSDSVLWSRYKSIHDYYNSFAPDSAIFYGDMAIADAKHRGAWEFAMEMHEKLCVNYIHIGDYGNAQKHIMEALRISEEIDYQTPLPAIYNSIGIIFGATHDYPKAIDYYKKAIDLNEQNNNLLGAAINRGNLCTVLLENKQYDEARSTILEALEIYRAHNNEMLESTALNNLGEVFLRMGQADSAQIFLEQALQLKERLGIVTRLPVTLNLLGDLHLGAARYGQVFGYYGRALRLADSLNMTFEAKTAAEGLYEFFKKTDNPREALKYLEIFKRLNDSIYSIEKDRQVKELEMRYQITKKNGEIEQLNSEILTQRRLRNLGILILLLAASIFILAYLRIRLRSQLLEKENELEKERSKQLKFEVAEKNRELMSHSMLSIQKNQILNDLKERLLAINDRDNCIHQAIKLVEENHSADSEWENLKIHFEQVHSGFFTKLQAEFPQLTATDLRHCAYIRIQMSSKDVARIMNVDPKSVKMSRYRLKKKFSLNEEDSLEAFLNDY